MATDAKSILQLKEIIRLRKESPEQLLARDALA
jgi:hypothetical protein